ncbi:class I SAM-dependent methyltransferase [Cellulomonas fimi]|uniref:Methyltransferase type 11 n=1 Tax=Cellulomonas fimi (strain ATCC 484 / DSM 20113 / JCM 1341 / CCUG 24087 / LMG 16345 / NBRC 15513 / NCIMB 8980 / NCTC 7547 / NRS-133) TaxID=590998 RepID=F4GYY2_CELFA|nr:class I SAM-dependent methyltransferase [Cellulomonas fimi]AEE45972.1 Methyltransferase type 11 [Cellulomonas fimi ATCC 484]NNH06558.1 class I SAM-dependent methyltransferase [Cellulomonas fimi]VEH31158.1 Ubiquinone/menaquinone biosynthesis methyltransferase ubiE [Cellulomonas fimi]
MSESAQPPGTPSSEPLADAGYRDVPDAEGGAAGRTWWDANAREYLDEHGDFLGPAEFTWCPEGLREDDAHLLGDVTGRRVLEIGAGAAQCTRWLREHGALAVATDVSGGMLAQGRAYDAAAGSSTPLVQADARALPFADGAFDVVFTAFGAIPFVPDADRVHAEAARLLRRGGRWVFAVTHPLRWAFPDDPSEHGLTAARSYFDRRPYVETGASGRVLYAEYHRTVGDHVAELVGAGFVLERLVEPEWPAGHERTWGGWGPVRGALLPGTAIFVCRSARRA